MSRIATVGIIALAAFSLTASAEEIATQFNGKLVSLNGKRTQPLPENPTAQAKYIALYFSAGWCGPCRKFSPELVSFYNRVKPAHPEFELVFVSLDSNESEMEKYMTDLAMPWPALRFSAVKTSSRIRQYGGGGIPCLVLLNDKGEVLSHSYEGPNYVGPGKVLADAEKLLSGAAPTVITSAAMTAPVSAVTASPSASPLATQVKDPNSPSGTNWDDFFKKKKP